MIKKAVIILSAIIAVMMASRIEEGTFIFNPDICAIIRERERLSYCPGDIIINQQRLMYDHEEGIHYWMLGGGYQ